jgi:hypothetical protein
VPSSVALRAASAFAMHNTPTERRNILLAGPDSFVVRRHGQALQDIYVVAIVRTAC